MEEIISSIVGYIFGVIEIIMYYEFMSARFDRFQIKSSNKRWIIYFIGAIGTYSTKLLTLPFPIILLINIVFIVCLGHITFKSNIFKELTFTMFYIVIVYLLDLFVIIILGDSFQLSSKIDATQKNYFYTQLGFISKLLLIAIIRLFNKLGVNKNYEYNPRVIKLMAVGFFISLTSIYCLIILFSNLEGKISEVINLYITFIALGIFFNNIIIYCVIQKLSDWINREKEYEVAQYQNEVLIKATLEKDEMNKEVRKIWHDFNNHMSCIDMLLQMNNVERARAYIKNMNASCQTTYMGVKTGNEIADVVINQKYVLAKAEDIDLRINGRLKEDLHINQMDLCALLCNSLDNAIEASRQIEDKEARKIKLSLKMYKEYVLIDVNNNVKEEALNNKKLITTKKDKSRHGIGMLSMQTIVQKYGGNLEWKYENNQFLLSIMIKNTLP